MLKFLSNLRWVFEGLLRIWEVVTQTCSVNKVLFEISQNLQENTRARVSILIKFQASGLQLYQNWDSGTGASL